MERRFRIEVRGLLGPDFGRAFGEVETTASVDGSVLAGPLVDAAYLDGILTRLRDLGLELVSVETTELPDPPSPAPAQLDRRGDRR